MRLQRVSALLEPASVRADLPRRQPLPRHASAQRDRDVRQLARRARHRDRDDRLLRDLRSAAHYLPLAGRDRRRTARERARGDRRHRHRGAQRPRAATATAPGSPSGCSSSASSWRTSRSSATARPTCARRSSGARRVGVDLVITSGGLGPDRRRPHGDRGRRVQRPRDGARRGARGADRRDRAAAARALAASDRGDDPRVQPQAGGRSRRARRCSSRSAPHRASSCRRPTAAAARRSSSCRVRRASCSRCGRRRPRPRRSPHAIRGATVYEQRTLRLFGLPESEIATTLRAAEQAGVARSSEIEVTTCVRGGELEIVTPLRAARRRRSTSAFETIVRERHAARAVLRRRQRRRRAGGGAAGRAGPDGRGRRVLHRRAGAGRLTDRSRGVRATCAAASSSTPTTSRARSPACRPS